jgi:hypothetical protein
MMDMKKSISSILETTTIADMIDKRDSAKRAKSKILDYCI